MPQTYSRGESHDLFELAAQAFVQWPVGDPEPVVHYDGDELSVTQICNLVCNSTSTLPGTWSEYLRERLDFKTRTYAAVSRAMRSYLKKH